jgi:hypothetical protein
MPAPLKAESRFRFRVACETALRGFLENTLGAKTSGFVVATLLTVEMKPTKPEVFFR